MSTASLDTRTYEKRFVEFLAGIAGTFDPSREVLTLDETCAPGTSIEVDGMPWWLNASELPLAIVANVYGEGDEIYRVFEIDGGDLVPLVSMVGSLIQLMPGKVIDGDPSAINHEEMARVAAKNGEEWEAFAAKKNAEARS